MCLRRRNGLTRRAPGVRLSPGSAAEAVELLEHLVIELGLTQLRAPAPQAGPAQRAGELAHFERHPQARRRRLYRATIDNNEVTHVSRPDGVVGSHPI